MDYPLNLPCPSVADYKGEVDFGLSSVTFNRGNKRRRKLATFRLEKYDVSFTLTTRQLWEFQSWANQWGYDWHYMPLVTHYSGFVEPTGAILHRCRFMSDINITALGSGHFRLKVSIEVDPLSRPLGIIVPSGNWIVAGTPPAPNNPDWYVAPSPANPSAPFVSAGTPVFPAA